MPEEERLKHIEEKVDQLNEKVDNIDRDLAKYRGMVGGVLLMVTAIVTFIKLTWNWLVTHVSIS